MPVPTGVYVVDDRARRDRLRAAAGLARRQPHGLLHALPRGLFGCGADVEVVSEVERREQQRDEEGQRKRQLERGYASRSITRGGVLPRPHVSGAAASTGRRSTGRCCCCCWHRRRVQLVSGDGFPWRVPGLRSWPVMVKPPISPPPPTWMQPLGDVDVARSRLRRPRRSQVEGRAPRAAGETRRWSKQR